MQEKVRAQKEILLEGRDRSEKEKDSQGSKRVSESAGEQTAHNHQRASIRERLG